MKDKKIILFSSVIVLSLMLLCLTIFLLVNDNKKDTSKQIYGVVSEKGSNYILVKDDDKNYYVASNDDIEIGTFVSVYYPKSEDVKKGNGIIDVVLAHDEVKVVSDLTTTNPVKVEDNKEENHTTKETTTTQTSTTKVTTSTKTTTYKTTKKADDADVITFAEESYLTVNNETSTLEKAKEKFITLVDFIFYDKEINGKKFDDLTSSAKAKIVYYTLMIDAKIDSKWPNYKNNISSKYCDVKAKLLAKYMDLTTSICESNKDTCNQAKSDFKLMKESINLTWSTLKTAFSYAFSKGTDALVNWYEIFSGKK